MKAVYVPEKQPHQLEPGEWCDWKGDTYARCPNGLLANLSGHKLSINGPILTVAPSIECTNGYGGKRFHGFIENGVWLDENKKPIKENESA